MSAIVLTDGANGGVPPDVSRDPAFRALEAQLRQLETTFIMARTSFARNAGFTFDNRRDMYGVLGYRDLVTTSDYRAKYQRGGIAKRIVDTMPDATWRGFMELIEDEEQEEYTPFEQAWHDFDQRLQVQAKLRRVDKLAGLSTYSVLLIGAADVASPADLITPLAKGKDPAGVLYLQPFLGGGGVHSGSFRADRAVSTDTDVSIWEYDIDPKSTRFGQPLTYRLRRVELGNALPAPVHYTRVLHVAEGLLDDEVFGIPSLECVWNLIEDLEKVTGGGAEAFWLRANQGLHLDVDKDMSLDPTSAAATLDKLKDDLESYKHGLTRWMRTRGVSVNTLGSDVANFGPPADAILTQIAGAKGIPKRVLTGSEMGELASSQDRENFRDVIVGRQTQYAGPYIVRPLVDRLIAYGYLPTPAKGADAYDVQWPHIQVMTEDEKAAGAQRWAQVNATFGMTVFSDAETRDHWYDKAPLELEQDQQDQESWRAALAEKMAMTNKTEGAVIFTDDEIRKVCYGWEPLTPEEKIPITAPERVSTNAPTPEGELAPGQAGVAPPALKGAPGSPVNAPGAPRTNVPGQPKAVAASASVEAQIAALAAAIEADDFEAVAQLVGLTVPVGVGIVPVHKLDANGTALCGQPTTEAQLTEDDADVTCVKCLNVRPRA